MYSTVLDKYGVVLVHSRVVYFVFRYRTKDVGLVMTKVQRPVKPIWRMESSCICKTNQPHDASLHGLLQIKCRYCAIPALANANSIDQCSRTVSRCHTCGWNPVLIIDQLRVIEREHPGSTVTARQIQYLWPGRTTDFTRSPWSL